MSSSRPVTRKSLPLTSADQEDLAKFRDSQVYRDALAQRSGVPITAGDSEASLLHSVLVAGLKAVREQVEAAGYEQIASEQDLSARLASARRRTPAWAEE